MTGTVVNCTNLDSVRIEVLGGSRAVTIPAAVILAIDSVLRRCFLEDVSLDVDPVGDDREEGWQAILDDGQDAAGQVAPTPWGAVVSLADQLK